LDQEKRRNKFPLVENKIFFLYLGQKVKFYHKANTRSEMFILYKMFICINKQFGLLPKVSSVILNISHKNTSVNGEYMYSIDSSQIKTILYADSLYRIYMISLACYQKSKQQHLIINRKLEVATFFKFVCTYLNSTVYKRTATHLKHGLPSCGAGVWSPENGGPIKWTFGLCFFYFSTITDIFSGNTGHVKYIYIWKSLASHLLKSTYQFCES